MKNKINNRPYDIKNKTNIVGFIMKIKINTAGLT